MHVNVYLYIHTYVSTYIYNYLYTSQWCVINQMVYEVLRLKTIQFSQTLECVIPGIPENNHHHLGWPNGGNRLLFYLPRYDASISEDFPFHVSSSKTATIHVPGKFKHSLILYPFHLMQFLMWRVSPFHSGTAACIHSSLWLNPCHSAELENV